MAIRITIIIIVLSIFSCSRDNPVIQYEKLTLVKESPISVPEPSGLSFTKNKTAFYTVSDHTGRVYKLSLTGAILETLDFAGDDLEGVTADPLTGYIFVVEERNRDVVLLDKNGVELQRFHLDIPVNNDNSGLEGIAFNPDNRHLYILNEKDPGLLVETDQNGNIVNQVELDFASDYSGIFYEHIEKKLWIVSDQSKTVSKCELNGEKIVSYRINDKKAEGIVVDIDQKQIFIVLDGEDKLQVYTFGTD